MQGRKVQVRVWGFFPCVFSSDAVWRQRYPLVRERKALSCCATNPAQRIQGHPRVGLGAGRSRHCCPKLGDKVQPCCSPAMDMRAPTVAGLVPRHQTHERFRVDVSLPWKTAPVVNKPISPPLELPSWRSSPRCTTKRRSCYFSLVQIARNLIFAVTVQKELRELVCKFHSGNSNFFFFFCGNVSILTKLALGKIPLGQNGRERAVPGH